MLIIMLIIVLHRFDPETTSSGSSLRNGAGVFTRDEMKMIRLAVQEVTVWDTNFAKHFVSSCAGHPTQRNLRSK